MAWRRTWTAEEEERLFALRAEGKTASQIAALLGRTLGSIEHKLYPDKGTPPPGRRKGRKPPEEDIEWLKENFAETKNRELGEKLGISQSTLHKYANMHGLKKTEAFIAKCQAEATKKAKKTHRLRDWPPKGYRVPNRHTFEKGKGVWGIVSEEKAAEMKRKRKEAWRKTYDSERRRVLVFGFAPKTKLAIGSQGRAKYNYRWGLRRKGYIEDPQDHNVYYYTAETERGAVRERNAARHNVKIRPITDNPSLMEERRNSHD